MSVRPALAVVALVLATLLSARRAHAHDVRGEVAMLDLGERSVVVDLRLPLSQLHAAAPELYPAGATRVADVDVTAAAAYVAAHLGARTPDANGASFSTTVERAEVGREGDEDVLFVHAILRAPEGASARIFEIHDDVVLGRIVTHSVYVFVRRDLRAAAFGDAPSLIGELHYQHRALEIDRRAGGRLAAFRGAFALGVHHIVTGTDHVLFLLMLLLPAPLIATRSPRAWRGAASFRRAAGEALAVVSAFTLGHASTLVLALGLGLTPSAVSAIVVETLVATSVLATAIHAIRPIFPMRSAAVAGAFGLVHGLAFSSALNGLGADGETLALALAGFNLGVEAVQAGIVVVTLPVLALAARGPSYRFVRAALAMTGAVASVGWIAERAFGRPTPTTELVAAIARHAPLVLAAIAVVALLDVMLAAPRARRSFTARTRT